MLNKQANIPQLVRELRRRCQGVDLVEGEDLWIRDIMSRDLCYYVIMRRSWLNKLFGIGLG